MSTSSATEPTFLPPCRFGGSSTLSTTRRGVTSTPSPSGVVVTILLSRLVLRERLGRTELVCIAVAQVLLRFDDERHWLRIAPKLIGHLFPRLLGAK